MTNSTEPLVAVSEAAREYRKVATIKASRWWKMGDHPAVKMADDVNEAIKIGQPVPFISTLEGGYVVSPGDWIATGVQGEHWAIKPDVFAATYEPVHMDFGEAIDPNAAHNRRARRPLSTPLSDNGQALSSPHAGLRKLLAAWEAFNAAPINFRYEKEHDVAAANAIHGLREAFAALASPQPPQDETETGWLIEEEHSLGLHWIALSDDSWPKTRLRIRRRETEIDECLTPIRRVKDASEALRFARKEDAEAFMALFARFLLCPIATEHQWSAALTSQGGEHGK